MVEADEDAAGLEFGRQMAVAEVPGQPHQRGRAIGADFQQGFGGGAHQHQRAVRKPQAIAFAHNLRLGQVEHEGAAAVGVEQLAAAEAVVEVQGDRVGGSDVEGAGWDDGAGDREHDQNRKYRCAIGSTEAGSHTSSSPSARTS